MVRFIIRMAITAAAVLGVAYAGLITVPNVGPGQPITVSAFLVALLFAVVLGLVNAVIKPILQLLAFPVSVLTLGIFALFINLGMFYLAAALTPVRADSGFFATAGAAIIIAFFGGIAGWLTERGDDSQ